MLPADREENVLATERARKIVVVPSLVAVLYGLLPLGEASPTENVSAFLDAKDGGDQSGVRLVFASWMIWRTVR